MDESAYTLQDQLFNPQEILMPKKHHNMTQDVVESSGRYRDKGVVIIRAREIRVLKARYGTENQMNKEKGDLR
jgi:hypothetical protein